MEQLPVTLVRVTAAERITPACCASPSAASARTPCPATGPTSR